LWGDVEVIGDDEQTVRVTRNTGPSPSDPTVLGESGAPVSVVRDGGQIRIAQDLAPGQQFASSDLMVRVPRDLAIQVEMLRGGEIALSGTKGDTEVTNHNGSVRLTDVAGGLRITSKNGAITGSVSGPLEPSASFASLNGEIVLTLPSDASATARLRTDNGRLISDFPSEVRERETSLGTGAEVLVDINGGGPPLLATTRSGDVVLRRRAPGEE
jgi:hypothetical protein